jgi:hypothetical protein
VQVRDGRIASWHSYYDTLALARQLGIAPPAGRAEPHRPPTDADDRIRLPA